VFLCLHTVGYVPSNKLSKTKSRPHGVMFPWMLGVTQHKILLLPYSLWWLHYSAAQAAVVERYWHQNAYLVEITTAPSKNSAKESYQKILIYVRPTEDTRKVMDLWIKCINNHENYVKIWDGPMSELGMTVLSELVTQVILIFKCHCILIKQCVLPELLR